MSIESEHGVVTAEIAMEAQINGWSQQQIDDAVKAHPVNQQQPPANEPPTPPANEPPAPPANEPPAPEPPAAGVYDFSKFGVKDETELEARLQELNGYKEKYSTLEQEYGGLKNQWEQVKPDLDVIPILKNPFANDDIKKLNQFVQKTGTDLSFASQVIGVTDDQLKADPILAKAIEDGLSDPALAQKGMEKLYRNAARELGVDLSDRDNWTDEQKEVLEIKGVKAIANIQKVRKELADTEDYFISSQNKLAEQKKVAQKNVEDWGKSLPKLVGSLKELKEEVEVDGKKITISLALSNEEIQTAVKNLSGHLPSLEANQENEAKITQAIVAQVRSARTQELIVRAIQEDRKAMKAEIEEQVRAELHNGGRVERGSNPNTAKTFVEGSAEEFIHNLQTRN